MKLLRLTLASILLASTAIIHAETAPAAETKQPAAKRTLQVRVEAPFIFDSFYADDVADALYWQIKEAFNRRDKSLEVTQLSRDDESSGQPVLEVILTQWRTTRMGDIECRFSADYVTADGKQSLGMFDGRTVSITRSRTFIGRDFEQAAADAGRQLLATLQQRSLL